MSTPRPVCSTSGACRSPISPEAEILANCPELQSEIWGIAKRGARGGFTSAQPLVPQKESVSAPSCQREPNATGLAAHGRNRALSGAGRGSISEITALPVDRGRAVGIRILRPATPCATDANAREQRARRANSFGLSASPQRPK
jgi:hypothetical protein